MSLESSKLRILRRLTKMVSNMVSNSDRQSYWLMDVDGI